MRPRSFTCGMVHPRKRTRVLPTQVKRGISVREARVSVSVRKVPAAVAAATTDSA